MQIILKTESPKHRDRSSVKYDLYVSKRLARKKKSRWIVFSISRSRNFGANFNINEIQNDFNKKYQGKMKARNQSYNILKQICKQ